MNGVRYQPRGADPVPRFDRDHEEVRERGIVAVRLGEEATLKRFHRGDDGKVSLKAENPQYSPIIVEQEDSEIIGKMVKLYRST